VTKNQFTRYKHDPRNPTTISNNQITSIKEDKNGTLWIGTFGGGLNRFLPKEKSFSNLRHSASPNSLSDDRVNSIFQDNSGKLWVGTEKGLDFFLPQKNNFNFFNRLPTAASEI